MRCGLLVLALASLAQPALADAQPTVIAKMRDGTTHLEAHFFVAAPAPVVWGVLTDYAAMPTIVPDMLQSVVRARRGRRVLVEQTLNARVFIVSRQLHLLLDVTETPKTRISFHDLAHRDFDRYRGTWELRARNGGTEISYQLSAKPRAFAPGAIERRVMLADGRALVEQLSDAMRRQSVPQRKSP